MAEAALIISGLSLAVAGASLGWNIIRSRAERRTDVRVLAWHDGMGMDICSAEQVEIEHVVAVRVVNSGERPEHVMVIGVESPNGERLADDLPQAQRIVDNPAPEAEELPARGQIARRFHLPAHAIEEGFIGFAILGTGKPVYSVPTGPADALGELQGMVQEAVDEGTTEGEDPTAGRQPPS